MQKNIMDVINVLVSYPGVRKVLQKEEFVLEMQSFAVKILANHLKCFKKAKINIGANILI